MEDAMAVVAPAPLGAAEVRGGEPGQQRTELYRRMLWLAAFRVAAVTVLVGTTAVITFTGGESLGGRMSLLLSSLAVGTNLLQIGVVLLARARRHLVTLALVQIAGDVLFAAALVYLTSGGDSIFTFLYLLAIVNGGIVLARSGAWFAAVVAFCMHVGLIAAEQAGWLLRMDGSAAPSLGWADLYQTVFTHGAAFGLMAVVASYVAAQLERAGERAEEAEESLSQLGALHDAIVRSISSGIIATDREGRITFVNRAGEEILGQDARSLRRRLLHDIFPALGATDAELKRLECRWAHPDGGERILGFTISPLLDRAGRQRGSSAVFQDLTPYRDLEARAARSERLATVGELSAGLAHELRNPLASMSGSIEMLAGSAAHDDEDRQLFGIVQREAERLNRLVTDFLGFARPDEPARAVVSLPALLSEVMQVFAGDSRLEPVELASEIADAQALIDEAQIRQVLWNLLLNAAQASPAGGRIVLRCGPTSEPGRCFLEVEDQGQGIRPEDLARIFDPFFTTKARGTGLGLSTVHRIVDAHGGQIDVHSEPGRGTRFTIVLPADEENR